MKISKLFGIYLALAIPAVIFLYYYPIIDNAWINSVIAVVLVYAVYRLHGIYNEKSIVSRDTEKKANTVEFFVYFFVLLALVTALFYIILLNFNVITEYFNAATIPHLPDIAESLNLIVGVPVAFAGSIVAIVISQRALTITARQERQDDINYIQSQVDKLNSVYWPLVISLRQLLHASIKVRDMKVSDHSAELFQSATANLISALDEINKAGIAAECWEESVKKHQKRTSDLLWSEPNSELLPEYLELEIGSLPTLIYSLENATMGITTDAIISKKEYFFPRQPPKDGRINHMVKERPTDYNIIINDVLFSGLLMYSRNVKRDEVGNMYTLNIGAAIISDLISFVPSNETILECLCTQLESVGISSKKYANTLKRQTADIEFQDGIADGLNHCSNFIKDNPQYLTDSEAFLAEVNIKDNPYHHYIFTQMI